MGKLRLEGVTHWSIPVNNLQEAEEFYREVLGMEYRGRIHRRHHDLLESRQPFDPALRT